MQDTEKVHLPVLPTGKPHISFSELATWLDCSWKHNLVYIQGLQTFDGNENTFFGGHVHEGCENYIKTGKMEIDPILVKISDTWNKRGYQDKDDWITSAARILTDVPTWMSTTFPNWEPIGAEIPLYENLNHVGHDDVSWKGYIDAAIKYNNSRGKQLIHILDWKTTNWGWKVEKLREFKTNAQVASYKIFWSRKFDVDMKDIKAGYVLLKRMAKQGASCQLIDVSVGPKMQQNVNEAIAKMVRSIKAGIKMKNRLSCEYCEFKGTEHCP